MLELLDVNRPEYLQYFVSVLRLTLTSTLNGNRCDRRGFASALLMVAATQQTTAIVRME
jgi:hypothetical protein